MSQDAEKKAFEESLRRVIEQAHANADDLRGAYYIPLDDSSGYQVEISKVES
ncbi:hypothetical protein HSBGL_2455 [Halapricum desulfuricans]|uniref:Uncharacterized protein n=1 Tax=Halapricum desulfuricans TaxID=2841257 RepID=A0A897NEL6_9EURY|nr:hypothetical protein [Halapricum desulfuricans]QSG12860.1 hypothetical protein HSBGL_2455 [Halapricum desulfuricans]